MIGMPFHPLPSELLRGSGAFSPLTFGAEPWGASLFTPYLRSQPSWFYAFSPLTFGAVLALVKPFHPLPSEIF